MVAQVEAPEYQEIWHEFFVRWEQSRRCSPGCSHTGCDSCDSRARIPPHYHPRNLHPLPELSQPLHPETTIRFDLQSQQIELAIYNLAAQRVATLVQGHREAGSYSVRWDGVTDTGLELASGVYFYRLKAGERVETRKLLLLR
ncbi:MAG TPA: hypothetical protein DIC52_05725 [Candidatus Latescibacteria bacterium]|jgi:hypothetical protein|nr:hypothetical protein [Candidatus Latescibacterota bacterium]